MLVISHFIPVNSVQINRCGCFIDAGRRLVFFFFFPAYALTHRSLGVFGEMMPWLMCLFPGDGAQRNGEEARMMKRQPESALCATLVLCSTCDNPRRSANAGERERVSESRRSEHGGSSKKKKKMLKKQHLLEKIHENQKESRNK